MYHIAVIGGDERQNAAADFLCRKGYIVKTWGLQGINDCAESMHSIDEAIAEAEVILLPLPLSRDHVCISGTTLPVDDLLQKLQPDVEIFGGKIDKPILAKLSTCVRSVTDYCLDENFMIQNAIPTAEGAVGVAMKNMKRTIFASHALVVGFGRIGRMLSSLLRAMGADVTVAARKQTDRTWAEIHGYHAVHTEALEKEMGQNRFDVIFNTVPAAVLTAKSLKLFRRDALFVELASEPGGFAPGAVETAGIRLVVALSLPGKVAPISAGEMIGKLVYNRLNGGSSL